MRSLLFVPGDRPERFAKAHASGADAIIIDLEDAVTPATRPQARLNAARHLRETDRVVPVWIRINPVQSADALADLAAVIAARPDGLVLPKARSGSDLAHLDHWLEALEAQHALPHRSIEVIALITETAGAMLNGSTFVEPPARVVGYSWGAEDLAADIGAAANRTAGGEFEFTFRLARAQCLLAAAAAGVDAYDTTDIEWNDAQALGQRVQASRRDGFIGKLAIHPAQIAPIHAAFKPTADEVSWARRVLAAMSGATGAVALDGRMIDRPHVRQAERILAALDGH
jgi:citrate lyase subunit beta / citryl-CoA lyase